MSTTAPTRGPRAERHASEFTELTRAVQASGLMRRRLGYYWTRWALMTLGLAGLVAAFVWIGDSWWQLGTAVAFAFALTQFAFLGHDAAHRQIFVSGKWNEWASLVVANLYVGMSYGWWQHKHTKHHANPNRVASDPDIDMRVLAFTPEQARDRRTPLTRWLAARQGWFFFPLLLLEGLNLHLAGLRRVFGRGPVKRRGVEITFIAARIGAAVTLVFLVLPPGKAAAFLGVQLGLFGLYMGAAFAPNHKGMPIVPKDLSLDFLRRQVLMSRNVRGGWVIDTLLGGLNYQVEHHLFPSMARPHLRKVAPVVRAFCAERGITYTETGLWHSYGIVISYLNRVGLGERDPFECPLVAAYR